MIIRNQSILSNELKRLQKESLQLMSIEEIAATIEKSHLRSATVIEPITHPKLLPDKSIDHVQKWVNTSMWEACGLGALRGARELLNTALQNRGFNQVQSTMLATSGYFLTLAALYFHENYQANSDSLSEDNPAFEALIETAWNLAFFGATEACCASISSASSYFSKEAKKAGWHKTANAVHFMGNYVLPSFTFFGAVAQTEAPLNTLANVAVGMAAEAAVKQGESYFIP